MNDSIRSIGTSAARPRMAPQLLVYLNRATDGEEINPGASLVLRALARSMAPIGEGSAVFDSRVNDIGEMIFEATAAVRTEALRAISVLMPGLAQLRNVLIAAKSECEDADVTHAASEVTDDGWLVVTMAGETIGRVPFNPMRPRQEAAELAENILGEYVRLHITRHAGKALQVEGVALADEIPADNRMGVIAFPVPGVESPE